MFSSVFLTQHRNWYSYVYVKFLALGQISAGVVQASTSTKNKFTVGHLLSDSDDDNYKADDDYDYQRDDDKENNIDDILVNFDKKPMKRRAEEKYIVRSYYIPL